MAVFYDDNALLIDDPEHSDDEPRFVCHCYRRRGGVIRIILMGLSMVLRVLVD
jgi:hypothetical protein